MAKKMLIVYCMYGSGHKSIAQAISSYAKEYADYEVEILDVTSFSNLLGRLSLKLFDFNIKYRPELIFDFLYEMVDNKVATLNQNYFVKKAFVNEKLEKELVKFNPDIVISTHFFATNLVAYYNKKGVINSKIVTVSTDYSTHSFWTKGHKFCDAFVVANEVVKNEMMEKGVNENKIYVFGMPYDQKKLWDLRSKEEIIKRYGLEPSYKTIVMFGGGSAGAMFYFEYFKILASLKLPVNIIFISGKNSRLETEARLYTIKKNLKNVKVLGFVNDVYSILNVANYCVTKPGAATITECMIMKVPMVIIPGYGGQEKYNARFVANKKLGYNVRSKLKFYFLIKKIVNNDAIYQRFKANLERQEDNDSMKNIIRLCDELVG